VPSSLLGRRGNDEKLGPATAIEDSSFPKLRLVRPGNDEAGDGAAAGLGGFRCGNELNEGMDMAARQLLAG
jgi:hypothetical protein